MLCRCLAAFTVLLSIAFTVHAESDPLDLARGLRDIGQPDLALEYIADLEKKNPPAAVKLVLPLERAKARLSIAQMETDETAREAGVDTARAEFEAFLKVNSKHPRAAEASLALAQVTSVQAINALNHAFKVKAPTLEERRKKRAEAAAATRPLFLNASKLFGDAAKAIDVQLKDPAVDAGRKNELTKASMQAELDRGINQYRLVDTYVAPQGKDVQERAAALDTAQTIFKALGRKGDENPVCWQARAWAGMCEYEKQNRAEAEKVFKAIKGDAARSNIPAAADGIRMVEFFEAFAKYEEAVGEKTKPAFQIARGIAKNWLDKDRYRPRMTPQRLSMTYYYAFLTEQLGISEVTFEKLSKADEDAKKTPKIRSISGSGYSYLKEAAREYKKLQEFDNEYSERAAENRNRAVRFIVGDKPRDPKSYTDLEEVQMAGFVQLLAAGEAKSKAAELADESETSPEAKAKFDAAKKVEREEYAKAVAYMERAKNLVTPATPPKEAADAKFNLAMSYYYAEQYALAAISGEAMARSGRGSAGAKGGLLGVECYLKAREKLDETADDMTKQADRDRAVSLGTFVDKTYPADGSTDAVRLRLGRLYAEEKQYQAAFDLLGKVSPNFSEVAVARAIQSRAAYLLMNSKDSTLTPQQKKAVYDKAVKDCEAITQPAGGPSLKTYFAVRNLLANLHLSVNTPKGHADAEKIATDALAGIAKSSIPAAEKASLHFASEEVRLRAIYAQAGKMFDDGKYKDVSTKLGTALAEMAKTGPAAATPKLEPDALQAAASLDRFRRDYVLLAMNGRIREGEFDKAAELFELMDKLGGSIDATTSALNRLVAMVRPQLEEFRKAKKNEDADKLATSIGALLQKQAEKPKLPARVQATLGRSLRDLGQYEKAIDVLKKVPMPPADKLAAKTAGLEEADKDAVIAYQVAQIELARANRQSKKFDEADRILKAAMGDDKVKGWAKSLEYRREAVMLLEDKAFETPATAPNFGRQRAWGEAKVGWEKIAADYAGVIRNKELAENEREKFVPVYLEALCDLRRCLARANAQLLEANPTKLAESHAKIGGQIYDVEASPLNAKALTTEVKAKYAAVLNDYPLVKAEYVKKGGKAFLDTAN